MAGVDPPPRDGHRVLLAGLFLGTAQYYQVWQSIPNPPVEAYTDSGPLFILVLGWIPATVVELMLFGVCLLWCQLIFWMRQKPPPA